MPKLNTLPWEQQNSTQMPTRHEIDEQTCLTDHYEFPKSGFFMNSHLKKQPPRIICNINRAIILVQAANKYIFTYAMDERFLGVVVKPEALIKLPLTNKRQSDVCRGHQSVKEVDSFFVLSLFGINREISFQLSSKHVCEETSTVGSQNAGIHIRLVQAFHHAVNSHSQPDSWSHPSMFNCLI